MTESDNGSRAGTTALTPRPHKPTAPAVREGSHVAGMQRRRLLSATVELVFEHGAQTLSVATVCERAALSRRTFYEIFDDREDCLYAAFRDAVAQAKEIVERATVGEMALGVRDVQSQRAGNGHKTGKGPRERAWQERIRTGLLALLSFFDYEPGIGRLLIVDALACGERTLKARRELLARIIALVEEGRNQAKGSQEPPPLTAEGIVGAVFSVIHARMLDHDDHPLTDLAGPLMAMIVQPFLGATAARRELARPVNIEPAIAPRLPADPFKDIPMRLTYRTARVLATIAEQPGSSSKKIAQEAGITDEGQTSKLLARLRRYGLIEDTGPASPSAKGFPRAWTLTQRGEGILQAVGQA